MPLDKSILTDFLGELDKQFDRKITLVAAGGTAMTLLDLKPSTIDVDFSISDEYYDEFVNVVKRVPHGFKIDCWKGGAIFSQILPGDYTKKSMPVKTNLRNIELRALHPLDIVLTKIGRLDERDKQDIISCIKKFKLTKDQITTRAKRVEYVGNEENYRTNLHYVIRTFF